MAQILILEDNHILADSWRQELQVSGHQVETSYSSSEAIALADARSFDLFIVDLVIENHDPMKPDSGRRFLRHLRSLDGADVAPAPVLGVSGLMPMGEEKAARSSFKVFGVEQVLMKPFAPQDLALAVEDVLAQAAAKQRFAQQSQDAAAP